MRQVDLPPVVDVDVTLPLENQAVDVVGERDFNPTAVIVLRKRLHQAAMQGATNIVVDVRFLDELFQASGEAMKHGYQSLHKI